MKRTTRCDYEHHLLLWPVLRLLLAGLTAGLTSGGDVNAHPLRQADPAVPERVVPAAVQIAIVGTATRNGAVFDEYLPVASGTVISAVGDSGTVRLGEPVDLLGYPAAGGRLTDLCRRRREWGCLQ